MRRGGGVRAVWRRGFGAGPCGSPNVSRWAWSLYTSRRSSSSRC